MQTLDFQDVSQMSISFVSYNTSLYLYVHICLSIRIYTYTHFYRYVCIYTLHRRKKTQSMFGGSIGGLIGLIGLDGLIGVEPRAGHKFGFLVQNRIS